MCQEFDRSRGEEAACAVRGETRRALLRCVCLDLDRSRGEETALAKSNKQFVHSFVHSLIINALISLTDNQLIVYLLN